MRFFADFVILSFAVFGFSYILYYTDGPWDVFERLRDWLTGVEEKEDRVYDSEGNEVYISREVEVDENGFFFKLFTCFWCTSTWIALFVVGMYYVVMGYSIVTFPFVMLGTIGVSGFLYEYLPDG